jgi:hypothetical protein
MYLNINYTANVSMYGYAVAAWMTRGGDTDGHCGYISATIKRSYNVHHYISQKYYSQRCAHFPFPNFYSYLINKMTNLFINKL